MQNLINDGKIYSAQNTKLQLANLTNNYEILAENSNLEILNITNSGKINASESLKINISEIQEQQVKTK